MALGGVDLSVGGGGRASRSGGLEGLGSGGPRFQGAINNLLIIYV